jgi:MFS family permease
MLSQETPPDIGAEMAASLVERDHHFRWNFSVLGLDIALFTLALNISSAYVVLPLFVYHLSGGSNFATALIPAVRALGLFGPQLLVAGATERLRRTKPILLFITVFERVPFLILAIAAVALAGAHPDWLLILFFTLILIQTLGGGFTLPPWLDLVARSIPDNWRGRFFGLSSGLGGFLGIGGAALATLILSSSAIGYPNNFALCFTLTFSLMVASFICLTFAREPRRVPHPLAQQAQRKAAGESGPRGWLRILRQDRSFRMLLIANAITGAAGMAIGLYAVAAKTVAHLTDAQTSIQNNVLALSSALSYFLLGWLGDRYGHRRVLEVGSLAAGSAALLAFFAHSQLLFIGVFLLTGTGLSAIFLAQLSFVVEFGPPEARPTYIALSAVAYAPFATFAPILGGWLADHFGYGPPFLLAGALGITGLFVYRLLVPDPRMQARQMAAAALAEGEPVAPMEHRSAP